MAKEFFIRKEQGAKKYKGKRKREKSKAGKTERAGKRRTENDKEQNEKKHKFSPTTSQAPGLRDTKNAAVGKTAAFWLKSRAAISCRHRFTALIYEK